MTGKPPTHPPRVVLDTNIVLSALVFGGGPPGALRSLWQRRTVQPLVSKPTAAELIRALAYPKFKLNQAEQEELLADYLPYCEVVSVIESANEGIPVCRDPADQPFLQLAATAEADFLVTGDSDLLALSSRFRVRPITTANAFVETLQRSK